MAFEKGHKKVGGRAKGALAKVDLFLGAKLKEIDLDWANIIKTHIESLPLSEQYAEIIKLLPKLVTDVTMAPLEMQINSTPDDSRENAAKAFEELKAAAEKSAAPKKTEEK